MAPGMYIEARPVAPSAWARWRTLSCFDVRTTLLAAALLPLMHVCIRMEGAVRVIAWLRRDSRHRGSPAGAAVVHRVAWAVARASNRGLHAGNCLSRSLTLIWLLGRHDVVAELRLGARLEEQRFEAHAWVVWEGMVLNDSPSVGLRFTRLG
ncbi:MAG TPA: lasso peptide biosynthesis B2 protein [Vicinamibacterales bacterium]|nr:lasso peptide biosynthesis B2 protein [Vicinamibacterales bacterium]